MGVVTLRKIRERGAEDSLFFVNQHDDARHGYLLVLRERDPDRDASQHLPASGMGVVTLFPFAQDKEVPMARGRRLPLLREPA
jgi:hypothetical protein